MTAEKIKKRIGDCVTLFGFEYLGKMGSVDPCYIPETDTHEYFLFYDGEDKVVYNIDDVMNDPFIGGKSLEELASKIEITEW